MVVDKPTTITVHAATMAGRSGLMVKESKMAKPDAALRQRRGETGGAASIRLMWVAGRYIPHTVPVSSLTAIRQCEGMPCLI